MIKSRKKKVDWIKEMQLLTIRSLRQFGKKKKKEEKIATHSKSFFVGKDFLRKKIKNCYSLYLFFLLGKTFSERFHPITPG